MPIKKKSGPAGAKTSRKTGSGARGAAKRSNDSHESEQLADAAPAKAKPKGVSKSADTQAARGDRPAGGAADRAKLAAARTGSLKKLVIAALDDMKALEVKVLDVRGLTDIADMMVIASGTSDRHVRSVAKNVVERTKAAGFRPHGVEGQQDSDWVLIDLDEMIVHVMLPRVREFYGLEKLWGMAEAKRAARA